MIKNAYKLLGDSRIAARHLATVPEGNRALMLDNRTRDRHSASVTLFKRRSQTLRSQLSTIVHCDGFHRPRKSSAADSVLLGKSLGKPRLPAAEESVSSGTSLSSISTLVRRRDIAGVICWNQVARPHNDSTALRSRCDALMIWELDSTPTSAPIALS